MGIQVQCYHCGYNWTYNGRLVYACCPSCRNSVRVPELLPPKIDNKPYSELDKDIENILRRIYESSDSIGSYFAEVTSFIARFSRYAFNIAEEKDRKLT